MIYHRVLTSAVRALVLAVLCLSMLFSLSAAGQAGSSPPMVIDQQLAYNDASLVTSVLTSGSMSRSPQVPAGVIALADSQDFLLWVELRRGRMHLLEQMADGGFVTRKVFPVSIGKNGFGKEVEGDKRTPVGVYHFTSFIADDNLIDFYGLGAYPVNYPNAYDKRLGRTGHGIWLHGLPKNVSERPLMDCDGCVIIDNDSLLEMQRYISPGNTYVVLSEGDMEWLPQSRVQARREALLARFGDWRRAWEAIDHERYLSFYGAEFSDLRMDRQQWGRYKRGVNSRKTRIEVDASDISILAVPGQDDLVSLRYYQDYRSNNHQWRGWKEQLWQHGEQGWQIVYEGNG